MIATAEEACAQSPAPAASRRHTDHHPARRQKDSFRAPRFHCIRPANGKLHTMGRLAVAQLSASVDRGANFRAAERAVRSAKDQCADLLCLPEAFDYLGAPRETTVALAQPIDGPLVSRYRALAAENAIWLSLGGLHEVGPAAGMLYNTHLILSATGRVEATYRKLHMFDAFHLRESDTTAPGNQLVVARDTPVGDVGLSTCYDLRFPRLYETLALSGAHVVLVPSAFLPRTGAAHWETLLRARAIENQIYVAAAAQTGVHGHGRESYGHSMIVDPWGDVLSDAGDVKGAVNCVDINLQRISEIRQKMPVATHRRDDIFRALPVFSGSCTASANSTSCAVPVVRNQDDD